MEKAVRKSKEKRVEKMEKKGDKKGESKFLSNLFWFLGFVLVVIGACVFPWIKYQLNPTPLPKCKNPQSASLSQFKPSNLKKVTVLGSTGLTVTPSSFFPKFNL